MTPTRDTFPPGKRNKAVNVRVRPAVYEAVVAYATRLDIPLAAAVDWLLASHPEIKPSGDA